MRSGSASAMAAVTAVALIASQANFAAQQARTAPEVTVHVTVERPGAAAPAAASPDKTKVIPTSSFAPWTLEPGLVKEDFEVSADGVLAPMTRCEPASGPVNLAIVVDASASMSQTVPPESLPDILRDVWTRAGQFGDAVVFGRVGGGATLFSPRITDPSALKKAARDVLPPTDRDKADLLAGYEASPIWDAVDSAIGHLERNSGRRAIVLLTDGRSTANLHGLVDVTAHALVAGVEISIVSTARDELIRQAGTSAARVRPGLALEGLATATGGVCIHAFPVLARNRIASNAPMVTRSISALMTRTLDELHAGYTLTFAPLLADSTVRPLKVRLTKPGLRIRAPSGYRFLP